MYKRPRRLPANTLERPQRLAAPTADGALVAWADSLCQPACPGVSLVV